MFSLFGKKEAKTKIVDRVFISVKAKNNALIDLLQKHEDFVFITWFEESYNVLNELIKLKQLNTDVFSAREIASHHIQNKNVIFYEHYPIASKEKDTFTNLQVKEAIFYSSLDEPLFQQFGGEKIIGLMQRMGMQENEAIEHPLISNAIKNAQEKIAEKVIVEHHAGSQAEWFSKNLLK